MKNSHLITTLGLVRGVLMVFLEFNKNERHIGRMSTLDKVLQCMGIVVNEEDRVLEEIVDASGKEEGFEEGQGTEKN